MGKIKIETTQNVVIDFQLADVGNRMLAKIIDLGILTIYYILFSLTTIASISGFKDIDGFLAAMIYIIFIVCPAAFYTIVCELFMNGQTFGKKIVKIRVINLDGSGVTLSTCLMRWLFQIIDYTFMYIPAMLVISSSKKGQRLGDIAAGTTIIKLKKQVSLSDTVLKTLNKKYQIQFSNVLELSDRDINTIREALELYKKSKNDKYLKILSKKVKEKLVINTKMKPFILLETILKDYNALALQNNE